MLLIVRISSCLMAPLLLLTNFFSIYKVCPDFISLNPFFIPLNFLSVLVCILLIIFPEKLEFLAFLSMAYSILHVIFLPFELLALAWQELFIVILFLRGFFRRAAKVKGIILVLVFLVAFFCNVRLGFFPFLKLCLWYGGTSLILLFISISIFQMKKQKSSFPQVLNLCEFESIEGRDFEWLLMVQQGERYKEIALKYNVKEQSVKNRLFKLYKILGVGDRRGFLTTYCDYKITFEKTLAQES